MTQTPNLALQSRKDELDKLTEAWGLKTSPIHPTTKKALTKGNEWEIFRAEASFSDPLGALLTADPKQWKSIFDDAVTAFTRSMMVDAAHGKMATGLQQQAANALKSPAQVDHVLKALPLAEVQADYTNAVQTLGDTIEDLAKAIDKDADATATYRSAEKKLQALQHWVTFALDMPGLVALADLPELWTLETWRGVQGDSARINYTEQDYHTHQRVLSAKQTTSTGKQLHLLAQEHWEGITIDLATTHAELVERSHNLAYAGKTQQYYSNEQPSGAGRKANTTPPRRVPNTPQVKFG